MPKVVEREPEFVMSGELCIPVPQRSSVARGLNSDNTVSAATSFRFTPEEIDLLTGASGLLGMKKTELLRWFLIFGCNAVYKEYKRNKAG